MLITGNMNPLSVEARLHREERVLHFPKPSRRSIFLTDEMGGDEWSSTGGMSSLRVAAATTTTTTVTTVTTVTTTTTEAAKAQTKSPATIDTTAEAETSGPDVATIDTTVEAETSRSDVATALQTLKQLPVAEFLALPPDFVESLEDLLKSTKLGPGGGGGDKKDSAGTDVGFLKRVVAPAVVAFFIKVVVEKTANAFKTPCCAFEWVQPYLNGGLALGSLFFGSGVLLQGKRPGLSNFMIKFGGVVMIFSILAPVALALQPVGAFAFALVAGLTVVLVAALY